MKIATGIILGMLVVVGSIVIPSPLPIGMYWSFALAAVFGIAAGLVRNASAEYFVVGIFAGYVAVFVYSLAFWPLLSFLLAVINLGVVAVGIASFLITNEKRKIDT